MYDYEPPYTEQDTIVWSPNIRSLLGKTMDPTTEIFGSNLGSLIHACLTMKRADPNDADSEMIHIEGRDVPFKTDEEKAKFWEEWRESLGSWSDLYPQEDIEAAIRDIELGGKFDLAILTLLNPAFGKDAFEEELFESNWGGFGILNDWRCWRIYLLHNPNAIANVQQYAEQIFSRTIGLESNEFANYIAALPLRLRRFDLQPNAWILALRKAGAEELAQRLEEVRDNPWASDLPSRLDAKKNLQKTYQRFLSAVHAFPPEGMTEEQYVQQRFDYSTVQTLLDNIYKVTFRSNGHDALSAMALVLHLMQQIPEILYAPPFRSVFQQVLLPG